MSRSAYPLFVTKKIGDETFLLSRQLWENRGSGSAENLSVVAASGRSTLAAKQSRQENQTADDASDRKNADEDSKSH